MERGSVRLIRGATNIEKARTSKYPQVNERDRQPEQSKGDTDRPEHDHADLEFIIALFSVHKRELLKRPYPAC